MYTRIILLRMFHNYCMNKRNFTSHGWILFWVLDEQIWTNHILLNVLYMIPKKKNDGSSLEKRIRAYLQEKNNNVHKTMLVISIYLKTWVLPGWEDFLSSRRFLRISWHGEKKQCARASSAETRHLGLTVKHLSIKSKRESGMALRNSGRRELISHQSLRFTDCTYCTSNSS